MRKLFSTQPIQAFAHGKKSWYLKHINDPYVKKANSLNYRSRASFKLLEILQKHKGILPSPAPVSKSLSASSHPHSPPLLDLGSAPGSWSQVLRQVVPGGRVAAVDLLEMGDIEGVDFYCIDARERELHRRLKNKYGRFELIVSDMAPDFGGQTHDTHLEILELNSLCVRLCFEMGAQLCSLVMKSVQGEKEKCMFNLLENTFSRVYREKPQSSRSNSVEFFYVCEKLKVRSEQENKKLSSIFADISNGDIGVLDKFKAKKQASQQINKLLQSP